MYEVILTSSPDSPITVFNASTGAIIAQFNDSMSPRRGLVVTSQGLIVASHVSSNTGSGSIHIYNWHTSKVFHNIPLHEPVAPLISTPDGEFLFAGGVSGSIYSLTLPAGDIIKSFTPHLKPISCLHLSDDGSLLISGNDDGTIVVIPSLKLFDESSLCNDIISHKWKAHSDSVTNFDTRIGIGTCTIISCSMDCTCKFWSLQNEIILTQTVTFPCSIFGFVMDSNESMFYAGGSNGFIYKGLKNVVNRKILGKGKAFFELVNWGKKTKNLNHDGSIVSLILVNEGKNLVSASEDGCVWMWDIEEGEIVKVLGNDEILERTANQYKVPSTRFYGKSENHVTMLERTRTKSVSDMIVVKGGYDDGFGVIKGNFGGECEGSTSSGLLCDEEIIGNLMKIAKLGNVVDVAVDDRRKAIDMLESAIAMYERLLRLILREVTKAIEEVDEDDDKNKKGKKK